MLKKLQKLKFVRPLVANTVMKWKVYYIISKENFTLYNFVSQSFWLESIVFSSNTEKVEKIRKSTYTGRFLNIHPVKNVR